MKSTGVVRKVDELGRVVLPIEIRRNMDIKVKDSLEIFVDGKKIVLTKYTPGCEFCSNASDLIDINGHKICRECAAKIKGMVS